MPLAVHLFTHLLKKRERAGVELVELVASDDQDHEEPLPEEPWPAWEPPAVQASIFPAPTSVAVPASVAKPQAVTVATDSSAIIRAWARQNGHTVKDTGRIPDAILKAYAKAHGGSVVTP